MATIVAGIINTQTGKVFDTITDPSDKTRLFLKTRDELNTQHGKNAFMVFEFNSMGGQGNLDYVRRNMQSNDSTLLNELNLLKARYKVETIETALLHTQKALDLIEQTREECLALYDSNNSTKREIVENAFADDVQEKMDEISSLNQHHAQQRRKVAQLENSIQD